MTWRELPDILGVGLLIYAFMAVSRPDRSGATRLWLIGWLTIEFHFFAFSFLDEPGLAGALATLVGEAALAWCALLFMSSMDPAVRSRPSRLVFWGMCVASTQVFAVLARPDAPVWLRLESDALFALLPVFALLTWPRIWRHKIHWIASALFCAQAFVMLGYEFTPDREVVDSIAPLTTAYLVACAAVWERRQRRSAGFAVIVIGLLAWALVFPVADLVAIFLPAVHVDAETWNLPKYLVAVGMILSLLEDQLRYNQHLAEHDPLTGLPNRRCFQERLVSALERARRSGDSAALLAIDLDGFKAVNDSLGHHVGDAVLQRVATLLATRVRRSDTLARVGGDEFAVILEAPTSPEQAGLVRQALESLLADPLKVGGDTVRLGLSIGLATFPSEAADSEALGILADQRMYAIKHTRRRALAA